MADTIIQQGQRVRWVDGMGFEAHGIVDWKSIEQESERIPVRSDVSDRVSFIKKKEIEMDGVMAEYTVREVREGNESRLQMVIHDNEIVAEGALYPIGLTGHPDYFELFAHTLKVVKNKLGGRQ